MKKEKKLYTLCQKIDKIVVFAVIAAILFVISIVHCAKIHSLQQQIEANRVVYVYDVSKLVAMSPNLVSIRQNYDAKIAQLSEQVDAAVDKLNNMRDKKAKAEYSEVYLNALTLKRNDLIEEYQLALKDAGEKINAALIEVANQKKVNAVFSASAIAVKTGDVVDITNDVLNAVK